VFNLELAVSAVVNAHLAEARKFGVSFTSVTVDADTDAETILPVWKRLNAALMGNRWERSIPAKGSRCALMRILLSVKRPESAWRVGEKSMFF
jgi:hypothetical protein